MPTSKQVKAYDRARTLETLCEVWAHNRDKAIDKAIEYARAARDTHSAALLDQAQRQRDLATLFDNRLKHDRAELGKAATEAVR